MLGQISAPASACLRIAMIWLSVNFDVFIKNLLRLSYEKILLLTSVNLRGDYPALLGTARFALNSVSVKASSVDKFKISALFES